MASTGTLKLGSPLCSSSSFGLSWTPSQSRRRCSTKFLRCNPISASLVEERKEDSKVLFSEPEARLIDGILGIQGRGRSANARQLKDVEQAVKVLEDLGGIPDPANSSLIEGRWQLIFTTRPGTASPIQRTFVGVDFFSIYQEIFLNTSDPRVTNIVQFSDAVGELKVEAVATVEDGKRILFRFDQAAFSFKFLPFKVPYPVPFRLLGDEAKGWLDTTYLSNGGNIRISRGNKGTTFVLQKKIGPTQRLLSAISMGKGIEQIIDELVSFSSTAAKEDIELKEGKWQLMWASQMEHGSLSLTVASGLKGLQIIKENGQLENIVDIFPGCKVCAKGQITRSSFKNFKVKINNGAYMLGSLELPLDVVTEFNVELLYSDDKIRITRGYKQVISVHLLRT